MFRAAARAGAEFFLLAVGCSGDGTSATAAKWMPEYSKLMYNAGLSNGLPIFYADQAGPDRMSMAFSMDHLGNVIDSCAGREGMIVTEISRDAIQQVRAGRDP